MPIRLSLLASETETFLKCEFLYL